MKIYFNTSVFLTILISNTFPKTIYNTKTAVDEDNINLNNFMNLLHNAQIDLKWIRDTNHLYRNKKSDSNWLYNPDLNFISLGDNHNLGDKWYKRFRDDEMTLDTPTIAVNPVLGNNIAVVPDNNLPVVNDRNLAVTPDDNNKAVVSDNNKLITQQNLQDQSETTKNDLSHEANYKLSKYEQEKEEKNRVDKENKMKFLYLPQKTGGFLAKRKIDPAEEIRLKIRSRMADKFETFVQRHTNINNFSNGEDYDTYLRTHRKIPNYNLFKRETPENLEREFTSRKLLEYDYEDDDEEQKYRSLFSNRNRRQKNGQNPNSQAIVDDMVTGILPNKLVKAIFTLAQKNENFCKHIVPNVKIKSFVELKKNEVKTAALKADDLKKKANDMISKIVKSISLLVEDQAKSQTCIPIKPELKQFVNKLLSVRKNSKILSAKFEFPIFSKYQEQNFAIENEIDTNRFVRSLPNDIDTTAINNKYRVIRNLQNSFKKLSNPEQIRYNPMKLFIDKHLSLLDELNGLSKLSRRNALAAKQDGERQPVKRDTFSDAVDDEFNPELNTIEIKQPFNDQMSERFIKLSKMVEFMRQNSLLDKTDYDFIGNDFIL